MSGKGFYRVDLRMRVDVDMDGQMGGCCGCLQLLLPISWS